MAAMPDLKPLKPTDARKLIREIVENGFVEVSGHARDEMGEDDLETTDCLNVLRGGAVGPAEYVNGQWRYRVATQRMCVVIAFASEKRLRIVTAWRNQR